MMHLVHIIRPMSGTYPASPMQWRIQDFWIVGAGMPVWIGAPVWKAGRQVKWQSRLWMEIKKIACPKRGARPLRRPPRSATAMGGGGGELNKMSFSLFGVGEYKVPERNSYPFFLGGGTLGPRYGPVQLAYVVSLKLTWGNRLTVFSIIVSHSWPLFHGYG